MDRFHKMRIYVPLILTLLFILLGGQALSQDWVALRDGTILQCKIAKEEDLAVFLEFKNGTIRVGREHIQLLASTSPEEFVPQTEEEKKQFEKGKIKFEGKWMSTRKRDQLLDKRFKEIKKKIDEVDKHKNWHHAYVIKTKSATIKSNAPKETVDFYVERWEAFVKCFMKDLKIKLKAGMKRKKPLVCIYKSDKDYQDFADPPPNARGFFSRNTEELHLFHDRNDVQETLEVLFHEGTHLLVYYIEPTFYYPTWMNEGMAEYISACTYDGKKFIPGEIQDDRLIPLVETLEKGQLMSVEEMIHLPQQSFLARGGYPPAWSFTHHLMHHKSYSGKYKDFFLGIARGKAKLARAGDNRFAIEVEDLRDAFKRTFKKDLYKFQDEWHDHIRNLAENLDGRAYYSRGESRYYSGDSEGARKDLKLAIDMGFDLPKCHYLLGMASAGVSPQSALNSIEKAIEMDPLNSEFYFGLGVIYVNYVRGSRDKGAAMMNLAMELDPDNMRLKKKIDYFWSGGDILDEPEEDD